MVSKIMELIKVGEIFEWPYFRDDKGCTNHRYIKIIKIKNGKIHYKLLGNPRVQACVSGLQLFLDHIRAERILHIPKIQALILKLTKPEL